MYKVGIYLRVRKACFVEGMSVREAARVFGVHRDTVRKMLEYSVPPGYRRQRPARRPKLDPYKGVMDQILEQDLTSPKKQRHTAKRIYERLRDEHGFPGKYTIVKDYVRERRRRTREMFVPLSHSPGHAQCDFGEAWVVIGGVERKAHYFALDLPHSDGCYVKAYPAETTESFCDGHVSAFAFLGGVPQSILYDNTTLAVARILGDGRRQRTRVFSELQSHYLSEDRFGRPGKGNDKGKVEGLVGYVRRNFLVPIPSFESFDALGRDGAADGRTAPAGLRHPPLRTGRATFTASGSPSDGLDGCVGNIGFSAILVGFIHPASGVVRFVPLPSDCPPSPCGRLSRPRTTTRALPHVRRWPKAGLLRCRRAGRASQVRPGCIFMPS